MARKFRYIGWVNTNVKHPALFFDLDGTLTDPKQGITRCIQYALQKLGQTPPSADELEWCIGPPLRESFISLVGEADADQAVTWYRERYTGQGLYENAPYPGVTGLLEELTAKGHGLYVASSKPQIYVRRILQHFALAHHFTGIYGSELDGTRSDKAELLSYALKDTAQTARASVMIGDRQHDAIGAKKNSMLFIGVLYGYGSKAELSNDGPVRLATSPPHIAQLLTWGPDPSVSS